VIEEPAVPSDEASPPEDASEQEPPSEGGDGEPDWQPLVAREAEAEPPAVVEALEDLASGS
jgi:hypothetical protein